MLIKNTTVQNRTKLARLNAQHVIPAHGITEKGVTSFLESLKEINLPKEQILYSLGKHLVGRINNPAYQAFLQEYNLEDVSFREIPSKQFDLLGLAYQYLNSKKENLERGSFYTGTTMAQDFVRDLDFTNGETILDPSCGSGSFLFSSNAGPEQIFGVDADPIAIMIAKFNYFIKFPEGNTPALFCEDFFSWFRPNNSKRFNYVIGNPPYGATLDLSKIGSLYVNSGESFSYFIEYSYRLITQNGLLRFLLPESILNVKRHTDIRNFILEHTNLTRIKRYSKKFSGIMSDVYLIELKHGETQIIEFEDQTKTYIPRHVFMNLKNHIFVNLNELDISIIDKVMRSKKCDLSQSVFGLGVVTGDNKNKLSSIKSDGSEPIYTGKEVQKYRLMKPKHFLVFDREQLQQVAPDDIYRSGIKLVYKVISRQLKVAIDESWSLTTNSANLIIPKIEEMDAYCVAAFLNSDLYSFLHIKLFGGVNKVAKENLMALPFPSLSDHEKNEIQKLVRETMISGDDRDLQAFIHLRIFGLDEREILHIRSQIAQ